jgi:uncharacterized protein (TIGR02757 family)
MEKSLIALLNKKVKEYNQSAFIEKDPIVIPHRFTKKADIEIAGLFAAVFAWGNRTTIINKATDVLERMDNAPFEFCTQHTDKDLMRLVGFVHRTFNDTDLLYFIAFLQHHYSQQESLETAFFKHTITGAKISTVEAALTHFHDYFFSLEMVPSRTKKHIASPVSGSTCKRLNMYLRWMVRKDNTGVDFGLWKSIPPSALICPVDVHVARVARSFGMIQRKQTDWETAIELTNYCRTLDSKDPVKYDFALFSLGVNEKYK